MNKSEHDPTLKEHFSENEARQWIRHLEKIIENLENREKKRKEKNALFTEKHQFLKLKLKRIIAHFEFLQEKYPDIDFGLDKFKNKFEQINKE